MSFRRTINLLWLVVITWLFLFVCTPLLTYADNFYGTGSLKPMVEESETTIYLPGGAKLATESDKIKYTLTDHLGSTRLAVAGDNTTSELVGYTPFGDTPADTTTETAEASQYTGMNYEPETATYDYHARAYDGSTARFTSPDAIRESISPYSYTENNPVNFVDPDGLGEVHFFLYTMEYEQIGQKAKILEKEYIDFFIKARKLPIKMEPIESGPKIQLNPGDEVKHLTIRAHGNPGYNSIRLWDPENSRLRDFNGVDFVEYLHGRLETKVEGVTKTIESICFVSCGAGRGVHSKPSFADDFAVTARYWFPNLKHIFASPHPEMYLTKSNEAGHFHDLKLKLTKATGGGKNTHLSSFIEVEKFFRHDFPPEYYETKHHHSPIQEIIEEAMVADEYYSKKTTNPESIKSLVSEYNLPTQHFRRISIIPKTEGAVRGGVGRIKTPSVDLPPRL